MYEFVKLVRDTTKLSHAMGLFISLSVKGIVDNALAAKPMHLGYALITTRVVLTDTVEDNEISRGSTCIHIFLKMGMRV